MRWAPLLLPIVVSNAITVWLLATGRLSAVELLLLISLEILGLQLIEGAHEAWRKSGRTWRRRLLGRLAGLLLRTAVLAALVAALWLFQFAQLFLFGVEDAGWHLLLDPIALFAGSEIVWPLAATLAGAAWDVAIGERGAVQSQLATRLLTLVLGAFPFIAPALLLGGAAVRDMKRSREARTASDANPPGEVTPPTGLPLKVSTRGAILIVAALVMLFGGWQLLPALFALGATGWMASFLSTKVLFELTGAALAHQRKAGAGGTTCGTPPAGARRG